MTREEAEKIFNSKWWLGVPPHFVVDYQLGNERLCMPMEAFRDALDIILGRGHWDFEVYTREGTTKLRREFDRWEYRSESHDTEPDVRVLLRRAKEFGAREDEYVFVSKTYSPDFNLWHATYRRLRTPSGTARKGVWLKLADTPKGLTLALLAYMRERLERGEGGHREGLSGSNDAFAGFVEGADWPGVAALLREWGVEYT